MIRPLLTFGGLVALEASSLAVEAVEPVVDSGQLPLWLDTATAAVGLVLLFWLIRMVVRGELVAVSSVEAVVGHVIAQHKAELAATIRDACRDGVREGRR